MKFYADLHLHSYYSRATSKHLKLEYLYKWAQLKGIQVIGTGDCIHPGWLAELKEKLELAEPGFYKLKPEFAAVTENEIPPSCKGPVRFMLTGEISNIYKRLNKVRKVHNVIFLPNFEAAEIVQARLEAIGNIRSDGRPILGLDSRDLLEIVLESNPLSFLIPAHIWTPWFSVLGSKGGFDRMEDCFADLTSHIFAVETGLSSDPTMNWRLKQLDPFIMVSNSDAHSPQKLAREATIYDTEFSYSGMYGALSDPDDPGLLATVEFFPEEGKYHYDGHRKCKTRMHPEETIARSGLCPVCNNSVTIGVMARVEELADRPVGEKPPRWRPFKNLIPLPEIIAETKNVGPSSKKVQECFQNMLNKLGSEMYILQDAPVSNIDICAGPMIAEAILRMRRGNIHIEAGYDGEYGTIEIFSHHERNNALGAQLELFTEIDPSLASHGPSNTRKAAHKPASLLDTPREEPRLNNQTTTYSENLHLSASSPSIAESIQPYESSRVPQAQIMPDDVNHAQWQAITHRGSHLLITAGPGTGKTHTLTYRIAHLAKEFNPNSILAMTFTHKAAEEMGERLSKHFGEKSATLCIGTFHHVCLRFLRSFYKAIDIPKDFNIVQPNDVARLSKLLWPNHTSTQRKTILTEISQWKSRGITDITPDYVASYNQLLRKNRSLDFDDLLLETLRFLRDFSDIRKKIQDQYRFIFVDEYQDINTVQHALLKELVQRHVRITAIGDPNQAIYGFRGSNVRFFGKFNDDFPGAIQLFLNENYRSAGTILAASSQVIARNDTIEGVDLIAKLYVEGRITIHAAPTDKAEAEYVVHQIEKLVGGTSMFSQDSGRVKTEAHAERSFGDIAILFRLNSQKNKLAEAFSRSGIPFQVFSDRPLIMERGIPETVTLLRLVAGEPVLIDAALHLLAFHVPGFGDVTADSAAKFWREKIMELRLKDIALLIQNGSIIPPRLALYIQQFIDETRELKEIYEAKGLHSALKGLVCLSGWKRLLLSAQPSLSENLQRLVRLSLLKTQLVDFIDYLYLQREEDNLEAGAEKVSLLTLHASKGLEFPVVFIVGCEEDVLPLMLEGMTTDIEEERRLFYVGMTRAKEQLYFVRAHIRNLFGKSIETRPSPFLADIEGKLKIIERTNSKPLPNKPERATKQLTLFDDF